MTRETSEQAILFADIGGSTELYERLGDQAARRALAGCIERLVEKAEAADGRLIKTIGDEAMCAFPSAERALEAACAMQTALRDSGEGLGVRIGFHCGPVISEGGDLFGDTVNLAARVVALALSGQILTSRPTVDRLPPLLKASTRHLYRKEVKGKSEKVDLYEVLWDDRFDLTCAMSASMVTSSVEGARKGRLRLSCDGRDLELERGSLTLGRGLDNDLVVTEQAVSRQHARFDSRDGKFILTDQSTNGTYVRFGDGAVVPLRRDALTLFGRGVIGFTPRLEDGVLIDFVVE